MVERRRIRLAAIPYEQEDDDDSTQNFRTLAYTDDGAYVPTAIKKSKKRRGVKVTAESTPTKRNSRSRKQSRRKKSRTKKKGPLEESNLMEELETTTWSLIKCGRKIIEKSIEEGKIQALKAAMRLRQENDRNYRPRSGRVSRRRRKKNQFRKRPFLDPSSSEESRSIGSASSYGSQSDSYENSSYSDVDPSMSWSVSSSKSFRKRKLSKSKSIDSLGENSIIANDSYNTENSSPSTEESLKDQASFRGKRSTIKNIAKEPNDKAENVKKEDNHNNALKMNLLLETESSDSWIASIQTDSNESFSTALNKELNYHRQVSSTTLESTQHQVDEISDIPKKGHQRKPTAELSDAEFLKVIRETVDQELGAKGIAATDSNQDFLATIEMSTEHSPTPDSASALSTADSSHTEPTLSNTDFLKTVQQESGVNKEPAFSNVDFLKALKEENGVDEEQVQATPSEPILSNADFLKAIQQENGVEEEDVQATPAEETLSNTDFLKAMQQENGVIDDGSDPESPNGQVLLSDDLSNADFLKAMKESLSATGGKFDQEAENCAPSPEDSSFPDLGEDKMNSDQGFSNLDFLQALRENGVADDDAISENTTSTQAVVNTNVLNALKQMGGMDKDSSMYGNGKLETILEVDSDPSISVQSSQSASPPSSYTLTEEDVMVVIGSHPDVDPLLTQQDGLDQNVEVLIMKQNKSGRSSDLPDLKCISSEQSDALSETMSETLQGIGRKSQEVDVDDPVSETLRGIRSQEVDVDDAESETLRGIDSGRSHEVDVDESVPETLKGFGGSGSHEVDVDDSETGFLTADEILAEDETSGFFSVMIEKTRSENDETGSSSSLDKILVGGTKVHEMVATTKPEGRQDEESSSSTSEQEMVARHQESRQDDNEERNTLIRTIQVDEALTPEEKSLLIAEIEKGVSIDGSSSAVEVDTSSRSKTTNEPRSSTRIATSQSRMKINKAIGERVLQGWTLLDSSCPRCVLPLMTDTTATEAICIFCDFSRSMNDGGRSAMLNVLAPPPPPPTAAKTKATKKRTKTHLTIMTAMEIASSVKHQNSIAMGSE